MTHARIGPCICALGREQCNCCGMHPVTEAEADTWADTEPSDERDPAATRIALAAVIAVWALVTAAVVRGCGS
jgi:hypothetical protein